MDFLVIDDEKVMRDAACTLIDDEGHYADPAPDGPTALNRLKEERYDGILLDLHLQRESGLDLLEKITKEKPGIPIVMVTAKGGISSAVEAMRRGAIDFLEKPFTRQQFLTVLARVQRFRQLGQKIEGLETRVREQRAEMPEMVFQFETPAMKELMELLFRAADSDASILLLGESGTGKSVAARSVHERSGLADKPFVTVSCPSLTGELLQSELFGHVRGAFTGAVRDHWGKVKAAEGGTLFLDEIGDVAPEVQAKLLRLLQEGEYERLGETATRKASVRVIAATNRDLKQEVQQGVFREDLYYRLAVITVEMPPLRERPADVLRLAEHYLEHFAKRGRQKKKFSPEARAVVCAHPWPGNLRELRNVMERAVILSRDESITPQDLPSELSGKGAEPGAAPSVGSLISLEDLEKEHIRLVVERAGNMGEAATVLGIDAATLYRKRKRFGFD
jgi:two-component system, NtrC family, response regulator AlgB